MKAVQMFVFLGCMMSSLQTFASNGIDDDLRKFIKTINTSAHFGNIDFQQELNSYLRQTNDFQDTPLHHAVQLVFLNIDSEKFMGFQISTFWKVIEFYIRNGADLQSRNWKGETPVSCFFDYYMDAWVCEKVSGLSEQVKTILTLFKERGVLLREELSTHKCPLYTEECIKAIEEIISDIELDDLLTKGTYIGTSDFEERHNSSSSSSSSHLSFSSTVPQSFVSSSELRE